MNLLQRGKATQLTSVGRRRSMQNAGGRTCLPKVKFSAKFPIGLHVILQIQIRTFKKGSNHTWKIILTENPLECNLALLLK